MEHISLLAATARVFEESQGLDPALASLVRLAVPSVADACAIQVLDGFRNVESVTLARIDAEVEGHIAVSQSRTPDGETRTPSHAALLIELAAETNLVLPLASRGAVLGSVAFGLSGTGGFSSKQIQWAEDFARGVSLGVENARLMRMAADLTQDREKAEAAKARAEAALHEGQAMLRLLVENQNDLTCILEAGPDRSYRFEMASPSLLQLMGQTGKDWKGRTLADLFPAGPAEFYRSLLDQVVESGRPVEIERESEMTKGMWSHTLLTPIRDATGKITHVLSSGRDISVLKAAQRKLEERETWMRLALEAGGIATYRIDLATEAAEFMEPVPRLLGLAAALCGPTWEARLNAIHPGDRAAMGEAGLLARASEVPVTTEFRALLPDGTARWVRNTVIRNESGSHLLGVAMDITERKEMELAAAGRESRLVTLQQRDSFRAGLAEALRDLKDPAEIIATATRLIGEILGAQRIGFSMVERSESGVHAVRLGQWHASGVAPLDPERFPIDRYLGPFAEPLLAGETAIIRDALNDSRLSPAVREAYAKAGTQAGLTIPIMEKGDLVAFLGAGQDSPRAWTADEIRIMEMAAERTWSALQRARAEAALAAQREIERDHLRALQSIIDVLPQPIIVLDAEGDPEFCNLAHAEAMGFATREEDIAGREEGVASMRLRDRDGRSLDLRELIAKALRGEATSGLLARRSHGPDAPEHWIKIWYSPVLDGEGKTLRVVASANDVTEIIQAKEALRESRAALQRQNDLLHAVLAALQEPVVVYEKGNRIAFANDALARFLGYPSAQAIGAGFDREPKQYEVFDAQGTPVPPERYSGARGWRGESQQGEIMRFVDKANGGERWFEMTTVPLLGAAGEVERVVISSHDVTELKRAYAEARQGRELLDAALNASPDALAILDAKGRVLYRNAAAARIPGFGAREDGKDGAGGDASPGIAVSDETGRPMGPDDPESPVIKVLRGAVPSASALLQLRDGDGCLRWIENKAAAIRDEWGRVRYVAAISVDITRLRAAQEAAAAHADRLRLALDVGRVGVWELDLIADRLIWTDRMCTMHGRLPGQPPQSQAEFLASIHAEDRPKVMSAFLAAEARNHFEIEYRVPGRYGEVRWFYSAGGYQRGEDGRALRFVGAAIEITERKRSEEAALQMQERVRKVKHMESISRMAGGMSHDFNNLLTAINGYADLILTARSEDRTLRDYASNIRESGERALKITQQLLAYSQKQMLETEVADANAIVRYMIDLILKLVDESVTVLPVLSPAPEPIRVDAGKLKQALLHVVMNALDAMPGGGRLALSTFFTRLDEAVEANEGAIPAGSYVVIEVADTGVGIAPEVIGRIFEPYFTTKPMGVKSGLGLSMVQGIVRQHGGYIQLTSEKGAGTRFRMYFPPADGTHPDGAHPPPFA